MTITGGCLCGSLRYATQDPTQLAGKCYCRDCQRETGTGHMTFVVFHAEGLTITGEAKDYVRLGDSGSEVVRTFCPSCGSTILGRPAMLGGVAIVRAGTLDDPSSLDLGFATYASRAHPWDAPPAGLTTFDTIPPGV